MIDDLKAIRKRRVLLGWSQHELAKLANVSQSVIAKIEKGRNQPTFRLFKQIDEALTLGEGTCAMKAQEVMTSRIITFSDKDSVKHAATRLKETTYSQAPVLSGDEVVGLVTEHSLLNAPPDDTISKHMEEAPPMVSPQVPVEKLKHMLSHFACVLVVEKGKRLGIVTKTDVLLK